VQADGKERLWRMPPFWLEMLEVEMVSRAACHVFSRYLAAGKSRAYAVPGPSIALFLNCLLGQPKAAATTSREEASVSRRGSPRLCETLLECCSTQKNSQLVCASTLVLCQKAGARAHKFPLLRRVCQRLGVRVLSKDYDMLSPSPLLLEDVVGVLPIVKSCVPASPVPDATEALEMARLHLNGGGGLQTAHELAQHASITLQQACNGMHKKYPSALTIQARVMYLSGDLEAAVAFQLKALAFYEQLTGFDSSQVINSHEHLAIYYTLLGEYHKGLAHMRAFCYLLEVTCGPHHPELATGYHRMGRNYQEVGHVIMALNRCYQEALQREPGNHLLHPRVHHNVAETLELIGVYKDALKHERMAY
ncbi:unnamed protein product, partial [Discosporangium mesarthrocarpum]